MKGTEMDGVVLLVNTWRPWKDGVLAASIRSLYPDEMFMECGNKPMNFGMNQSYSNFSDIDMTKTGRFKQIISWMGAIWKEQNVCLHWVLILLYRSVDKSLAQPGRKQATATEDLDYHISCL